MCATIERMKPMLGTYLAVRAAHPRAGVAIRAVDAAFAAARAVHERMSFHLADSDVSRMNRMAATYPVTVHPETLVVLRAACRLSAATGGLFDITMAPALVRRGLLPRPAGAPAPDPLARWSDIRFLSGGRVRFRRPLWLDLGGIAKGFAVDRAIEALRATGVAEGCVNAGGDLRLLGTRRQEIAIRVPGQPGIACPAVQLADAAVASSAGYFHEDAQRGCPQIVFRSASRARFDSVSVIAPECMPADALTKVVLGAPNGLRALLAAYDAEALVCKDGHWQRLGAAA